MASQTPKASINAFEIDPRVTLKIEPELAVALGRLILETNTENTALLALGHRLRSIQYVVPKRPDTEAVPDP